MNPTTLNIWLRQLPRPLLIGAFIYLIGCLLAATFGSTGLGVGLLLAGALTVLALVKPGVLVWLLAAYLPFEPFVLKFVPDDIYIFARYGSEALIYLLLAGAAIYRWRTRTRPSLGPAGLWLVAFMASAVVSIFFNDVPLLTAGLGLRQILRFPLLGLAVANLPISRRLTKLIIWTIIGLMLIQSVIGISQSLIGSPADAFLIPSEARLFGSLLLTPGTDQYWTGGQRITGTMGRYDQLGMFLSFSLLLVVGLLYQTPPGKRRQRLFFILAVGLAALALTYSRAAWFGFAGGALLISIVLKGDRRILIGAIIAVLIIVLYPFITQLVVDDLIDQPDTPFLVRFYEAFSYERWRSEYYGLGRTYFAVATVTKVFPAAPLFGFGPGQYGGGAAASLGNTTVYDQLGLPFGIYGTTGQIDNNWLSLLGETGAVGLMLYWLMFVSLARRAWQVFRRTTDRWFSGIGLGFLGVLLAVTLQAFLGSHLEVRTLGAYLWLVPSLLLLAPINQPHENSPGQ